MCMPTSRMLCYMCFARVSFYCNNWLLLGMGVLLSQTAFYQNIFYAGFCELPSPVKEIVIEYYIVAFMPGIGGNNVTYSPSYFGHSNNVHKIVTYPRIY